MSAFRRFTLLLALCASPAAAQGFENLEQLEMQLAAALGANIGEPGGPAHPIDRRLKLAACPTPATIEPPALGAATIRCAPLGWRIRVPLTRGATAPASVAGPASSEPRGAPVIRRGDRVELLVQGAGFTVSTALTAEQDGAPGDRIRLRGDRAAAPVTAEVTADGRAVLR